MCTEQLILSTLLQVLIMHDVQPGHILNINKLKLLTLHFMSSAHWIFLPPIPRLMLWNVVGNRYRILVQISAAAPTSLISFLLSHQQQLMVGSLWIHKAGVKHKWEGCTRISLMFVVIYQIIESCCSFSFISLDVFSSHWFFPLPHPLDFLSHQ